MTDERGGQRGVLPRGPVVWQGSGQGKEINVVKNQCLNILKKCKKMKKGHQKIYQGK